ncbi:hypothetical protein H0266_02410 [Halobacillus locisalis]|uniref:Uncharacterized protein n=1 Tax=Halobacillus locisalis TaxID=220753 RepID=A0A838CPC5_9BACI|nr:hypothetical protein [Halobacillus locisalis]MBA2173743.1 hypothetical protein [Halobacillus locisalis]
MNLIIIPLTLLIISIGAFFLIKGYWGRKVEKENKRHHVNMLSGGSLLVMVAVLHIFNQVS